jgi:hypothetical protein
VDGLVERVPGLPASVAQLRDLLDQWVIDGKDDDPLDHPLQFARSTRPPRRLQRAMVGNGGGVQWWSAKRRWRLPPRFHLTLEG